MKSDREWADTWQKLAHELWQDRVHNRRGWMFWALLASVALNVALIVCFTVFNGYP